MPVTGMPEPSVGLVWYANGDPTGIPGVAAPLYQLLVRTDASPGIYWKSGPSNEAWALAANVGGGGGGGGIALSAAGSSQSTGTVVFSNSNNVSFGMAGAVVTASATFATVPSVAISAAGNSQNTGTVVFSNANGVTFGMAGAIVTASVAAPVAQVAFGISAGSQSVSTGTLSFANSNGISFGMSGSNQITAKMPSISYWDNVDRNNIGAAIGSSSALNISFQRVTIPNQLNATELDILGSLVDVASTQGSYTISVGIYSISHSTLQSLSITSVTVGWTSSGGATATAGFGGQSGVRYRSVSLPTWNITPGDYMLAIAVSLDGVVGTTPSMSVYGKSAVGLAAFPGAVAPNYFAEGLYSAGSAALPTTVNITDINQSGNFAARQPYVRMMGTF